VANGSLAAQAPVGHAPAEPLAELQVAEPQRLVGHRDEIR